MHVDHSTPIIANASMLFMVNACDVIVEHASTSVIVLAYTVIVARASVLPIVSASTNLKYHVYSVIKILAFVLIICTRIYYDRIACMQHDQHVFAMIVLHNMINALVCDRNKVHACIMRIVFACAILKGHACTVIKAHACTMIKLFACTGFSAQGIFPISSTT